MDMQASYSRLEESRRRTCSEVRIDGGFWTISGVGAGAGALAMGFSVGLGEAGGIGGFLFFLSLTRVKPSCGGAM